MTTSIHNIIAAISPDLYCDPSKRSDVKKIVKEGLKSGKKGVYLNAAKEAVPLDMKDVYSVDPSVKDPLSNWGLTNPTEMHEIEYDSASESLEPLYFWILDFMRNQMSIPVEKVVDNFTSSPGSGHFSEMGQKATRMQEEAMKMLGQANTVIKSILNIIYDLKEFKMRLALYQRLKSKDSNMKQAAMLSLKQIWLDNVDAPKRGNSSIKALAISGQNQPNFVTLIDAFMVANTIKDVDNLDLNDRVKRILKQRVGEFQIWLKESEKELTKRYNIEKTYLRGQVASVKMYSRWIKPYLRAARKLEQNAESQQEALVTAFNTMLLELTIMGKTDYNPKTDVDKGVLPEVFEKVNTRKYTQVVVVEFSFRGIPYRVSQRGDWSFGGRTIIKFKSYALNEEEVEILKEEIERDDLGDAMKLIEGSTEKSLEELQKDINEFLDEDDTDINAKMMEEEKRLRKEQDINPFTSLFSFLKRKKNVNKEEKLFKKNGIKPDNEYEKVIRSQAILNARSQCYTIFDVYKRAHKMPAFENPFD